MLDHRQYLIEPKRAERWGVNSATIMDAETKIHLGHAQEQTAPGRQWARFFIGRNYVPQTVSLHESPDDSLLIVLNRYSTLLRMHLEIHDAVGELLGTVSRLRHGKFESVVHDHYGKVFADIRGNYAKRYEFQTPELDYTLATAERTKNGSLFLVMSEDLEEQPLPQMLILGAVLLLELLVIHTDPNSTET